MALPRFIERAVDAAVPALGDLDRSLVRKRLDATRVNLQTDPALDNDFDAGFLLAANLLARLYPEISLTGPEPLVARATALIEAINPSALVRPEAFDGGFTLNFQIAAAGELAVPGDAGPAPVSVWSCGWDVYVDRRPERAGGAAAPASLAAAAFGTSELFRQIFAGELGERGREGPSPGRLNMVSLSSDPTLSPNLPISISTAGRFRLIGAGAIGQAAMLTLNACEVEGTVTVHDHESIDLSNLQRYLLTEDSDVGAVKVDLLRHRLRGGPLRIDGVPSQWEASGGEAQLPTLVALDTAQDRRGVQASLPGPIYNAWTQPADIGWSRHECFGEEPCLACVYWPRGSTPHQHEQIAEAFGIHPLRALGYLVLPVPVGAPLPVGGIPNIPDLPAPADAEQWLEQSLLAAIAKSARVELDDLSDWQMSSLADLYQEGICGGTLLQLESGAAPEEVVVPLAHQSALAGIFLATQFLIASHPGLAQFRPAEIEARIDVLGGLPEYISRPRARSTGCWCEDPDFLAVAAAKMNGDD